MKLIATYISNNELIELTKRVNFNEYVEGIEIFGKEVLQYVNYVHLLSGIYSNISIKDNFIIGNFKKCILEIDLNINYFPDNLFQYCVGLYSLDISQTNIKELPNYFCNMCISLQNISFPNTLETIGEYSFDFCSFSNIDLSTSQSLYCKKSCFAICIKLKSLKLPKNVRFEEYAFVDNMSLNIVNDIEVEKYKESIQEKINDFIFVLAKLSNEQQLSNDHSWQKFIISQNNKLIYDHTDRHIQLMDKNDKIFFGGGHWNEENNELFLYGISDAAGIARFDKLDYSSIPKHINKIHIINNE